MESLTREGFERLARVRGEACVSLYLATYRGTREVRKGATEGKSLLDRAEEELRGTGMGKGRAAAWIAPLREALAGPSDWQVAADGVAFFLAKGELESLVLPAPVKPLVVVAGAFHLKPLYPFLGPAGRYLALCLSQKKLRLFEADRFGASERELPEGVPASMEVALALDEPQTQLQFHTGAQPMGMRRGRAAIFHGHGGGADWDRKDNVLRYFQAVDRGLHALFNEDARPLILFGVEYLLPIFHEACTYPHVMADGVPGNADLLREREIHEKSWPIVAPIFQEERNRQERRFHQIAGTGLTETRIPSILRQARDGRVACLFVDGERQVWGTFDEATGDAQALDERIPGDTDLLDRAVVETLARGGTVYVEPAATMPGGHAAAAMLRY